jgi:aldose 1-epimerase
MSSRLRLAHDALVAEVAPLAGGSLARFDAKGQAMMRPCNMETTDPLAMACYPLVPFPGRIAHARFAFEGREIALTPDPIALPHALHGLGWRRPWRVIEADGTRAMLGFTNDGNEWPWEFEARETFALGETALTIALEIENRAATAMPAGLGLHPFFPGRTVARLTGDMPSIWEAGLDRLPLQLSPVQAVHNFTRGRRIAPLTLDHCFSGSDGPLDIEWEDGPLKLRIDRRGAAHTMIYTPQEHDFFCVEPVSHAPNAVNRDEPADVTGLQVLQPGETMRLECRFEVRS